MLTNSATRGVLDLNHARSVRFWRPKMFGNNFRYDSVAVIPEPAIQRPFLLTTCCIGETKCFCGAMAIGKQVDFSSSTVE